MDMEKLALWARDASVLLLHVANADWAPEETKQVASDLDDRFDEEIADDLLAHLPGVVSGGQHEANVN